MRKSTKEWSFSLSSDGADVILRKDELDQFTQKSIKQSLRTKSRSYICRVLRLTGELKTESFAKDYTESDPDDWIAKCEVADCYNDAVDMVYEYDQVAQQKGFVCRRIGWKAYEGFHNDQFLLIHSFHANTDSQTKDKLRKSWEANIRKFLDMLHAIAYSYGYSEADIIRVKKQMKGKVSLGGEEPRFNRIMVRRLDRLLKVLQTEFWKELRQ